MGIPVTGSLALVVGVAAHGTPPTSVFGWLVGRCPDGGGGIGGIAGGSVYVCGDGCFASGLSFSSASTYYSDKVCRLSTWVLAWVCYAEGRANAL
jgi:hypothetical protein